MSGVGKDPEERLAGDNNDNDDRKGDHVFVIAVLLLLLTTLIPAFEQPPSPRRPINIICNLAKNKLRRKLIIFIFDFYPLPTQSFPR